MDHFLLAITLKDEGFLMEPFIVSGRGWNQSETRSQFIRCASAAPKGSMMEACGSSLQIPLNGAKKKIVIYYGYPWNALVSI